MYPAGGSCWGLCMRAPERMPGKGGPAYTKGSQESLCIRADGPSILQDYSPLRSLHCRQVTLNPMLLLCGL